MASGEEGIFTIWLKSLAKSRDTRKTVLEIVGCETIIVSPSTCCKNI